PDTLNRTPLTSIDRVYAPRLGEIYALKKPVTELVIYAGGVKPPTSEAYLYRPAPTLAYPRERNLAQPEPFYPEDDPHQWLTQFERIVSQARCIWIYPEGSALGWYEENFEHWKTYDEFKDDFKKRYSTPMK
ncbi:hypothetical protein BX616_002312, partial [Lobosporangium transversale]